MGNATSGSKASIDLALDSDDYYPGSEVRGFVQADLKETIKCTGVFVELGCNAHTRLQAVSKDGKRASKKKPELRQSNELLGRVRVQVARVKNGVVPPGKYQFPFTFHLSEDTPPSVLVNKDYGCFAGVTYFLSVHLTTPGSKTDIQSQYWFRVLTPSKPNLREEVRINAALPRFSRMCCVHGGLVRVDATINKSEFELNEPVQTTIMLSTKSRKTEVQVEVFLAERIMIMAQGKSRLIEHKGAVFSKNLVLRKKKNFKGEFPVNFDLEVQDIDTETLSVRHALIVKLSSRSFHTRVIEFPVSKYGFYPISTEGDEHNRVLARVNGSQRATSHLSPRMHKLRNTKAKSKRKPIEESSVTPYRDELDGDDDGDVEDYGEEGVSGLYSREQKSMVSIPQVSSTQDYQESDLIPDAVVVGEPIPFVADAEVVKASDPYAVSK